MADQGKKVGRMLARCKAYRTSQRREFNKARRLKKHLRKHPQCADGWVALEKLSGVLYSAQRSALNLSDFIANRYAPQEIR